MTISVQLFRELQISRHARNRYQFDDTLFSQHGDVIFADFHAVREFVQRINNKRNLVEFPEKAIHSGDVNAMGLIHEVSHYIIGQYRTQVKTGVFAQAMDYLLERYDQHEIQQTLTRFTDAFPPLSVYLRENTVEQYLDDKTDQTPHRQVMLEEMILLWLANTNPAFDEFRELFDDQDLEKSTSYVNIINTLDEFFDTQPHFGPDDQQLLEMLQAPAKSNPHSIAGQLDWIRTRWGPLLGKYFYRLMRGLDFIEEEHKARFAGPGPTQTYDFTGEADYERFSQDLDWMPKVVLLAKNTYVWLDQLSGEYQREIHTLDQIPDAELDKLARWGITGLWLIGLWERSEASQRIKQMMGNPEAVASAYSLYDYVIANDLGGEQAYANLRQRARDRGIRLSGDMVPNHVGIDGKWVIEHPGWFVQLDHSPYPSYSFNGPDLSRVDDVGIFLEDHYYERSDAAVVFKRVDYHTGETRFIYHGNDGTSMPWNDTAQLNYLNNEVREAVIQTILHVANKFDIIRFDAAMTLAKKHYQRLWFPEPGSGGDIPSRAEYGITKEDFNKVFPKEFWREVVDRVAEEEPDTLLLAEAFWLMEGYFVRTLGMHRVYNSAFMNMLKNEENKKYRQTIKNVLEFNPEILKRFVNFMNNPDEETAVAQFGKDDKYFGTCILMVTMPGLPMIGHGQIEGYTEKYGMEYKRSYWDEAPDQHLVQRHEREVFPLLHKRNLFADVRNFLLYDFYSTDGSVNENVYAYSNRVGDERSLVVFNNKYEAAKGWIKTSSAQLNKSGNLVQKNLGEGLQIKSEEKYFCIFRDHITGLEFIRDTQQLHHQGLYVELEGFKYQVFLNFREVYDEDGLYRELADYLNGRGVPDIQEALRETMLQPIHKAARPVLNKKLFTELIERAQDDQTLQPETIETTEMNTQNLLQAIQDHTGTGGEPAPIAREIREILTGLIQLPSTLEALVTDNIPKSLSSDIDVLLRRIENNREHWGVLLSWSFVHSIGKLAETKDFAARSRTWIDELLFHQVLSELLTSLEISSDRINESVDLIKILTNFQEWYTLAGTEDHQPHQIMESLLKDRLVREYLQVNRYQDVLWFNEEMFTRLTFWLRMIAVVRYITNNKNTKKERLDNLAHQNEIIRQFERAKEQSGYKVERLLEELKA